VASQKKRSVKNEIQSTIKSWDDLGLVKAAMNLEMLVSVIAVAELAIFVCLLVYLLIQGVISLRAVASHLMLLAVGCSMSIPYFRKIENDFRNIRVESDDPEIAATFERWLKQWKELRLKLPD
jgi:hypothetical protein